MKKEISYLKFTRLLLSRWPWLLLSTLAGVLLAKLYLSLINPMYLSHTSLKFDERRSELSELTSIRNIYDRTNKIESEKLIIRSDRVLNEAFKSLNYDLSFYTKENFKRINHYPERLLDIDILKKQKGSISSNFFFRQISPKRYELSFQDQIGRKLLRYYPYGAVVKHPLVTFRILKRPVKIPTGFIEFHFNHESEFRKEISQSLKIDDYLNVNVLYLSMCHANPNLAADALNAIVDQYLRFDRSLRSSSAEQTENFIKDMLDTLSLSANISRLKIQRFKEIHPTVTITEITAKLALLENEKRELGIKEVGITSLLEKRATSTDSFNQNLQGVTDPQLTELLNRLNKMISLKKEKLNSFTAANPVISEINEQITDLEQSIGSNLKNQQISLRKQMIFLQLEMLKLHRALKELPGRESIDEDMQSKFASQQKINTYLTEKKMEAQISKSAVTSGATVIDSALAATEPIFPITGNTYFSFILCSILLSSVIIIVCRLANPYIYNHDDIAERTCIPVMGIIRYHKPSPLLSMPALQVPRSPFSESIRGLRSNLSFIATGYDSKIIYISSEISGEGKSFIALNLGIALSLTGKRALLIAADLRKSNLHQIFQVDNRNGLSNYLASQSSLEEILKSTEVDNLDFIPSGIVPPNPSELLLSQRMTELLTKMREKYDFILLDSAPVGLVSDGKPLIRSADINLFVLRSGLSKHQFIATAERLKNEFQLSNIALVLNGFKEDPYRNSLYKGEIRQYSNAEYQYPTQHPRQYQNYFEL